MSELILEPHRLHQKDAKKGAVIIHPSNSLHLEQRGLRSFRLMKRLSENPEIIARIHKKEFHNVITQEGPFDCMFCAFVNALDVVRGEKKSISLRTLYEKRLMVNEVIRLNGGLRFHDYGFSSAFLEKYAPEYKLVQSTSSKQFMSALFLHGAVGIVGLAKDSIPVHSLAFCLDKNEQGKIEFVLFGDVLPQKSVVKLNFDEFNSFFKEFFAPGSKYFFFLPKNVAL